MKRLLSILFVYAAVAVTLAASVVPHHHHGAVACAEAHLCGAAECDGGHDPHGTESTGHAGGCVVDTPFIDHSERNNKGAEVCSADCGHHGHAHLFILADLHSELSPERPVIATGYGGPVIHSHSVDVVTGVGLRAPPVVLC